VAILSAFDVETPSDERGWQITYSVCSAVFAVFRVLPAQQPAKQRPGNATSEHPRDELPLTTAELAEYAEQVI
jgi:hypothetical protein